MFTFRVVARRLVAVCAGIVLASLALPARGSTVTLAELLANDGPPEVPFIDSGDKRFDQFTYLFTGNMPSPDQVMVTTITDLDGNFGIQFQGAFMDFPGDNQGSDAFVTFRVTVTDPNYYISDAHLIGNPAVTGGTGIMQVVETFLPDDPIAQLNIFRLVPPNTIQQMDQVDFTEHFTTLHVQKDILAFGGTGVPSISFIDQTFSQEAVPEPGAVALMGIGSFVSLGYVWRKKRRARVRCPSAAQA